jgi:hypothetical protein
MIFYWIFGCKALSMDIGLGLMFVSTSINFWYKDTAAVFRAQEQLYLIILVLNILLIFVDILFLVSKMPFNFSPSLSTAVIDIVDAFYFERLCITVIIC